MLIWYVVIVHMLARQFREAKRIAEEEKSISVKVEKLKEEVDHVEEKLSSLNETLGMLNMELAATRKEREVAERQHGGCVYIDTLLCSLMHLNVTLIVCTKLTDLEYTCLSCTNFSLFAILAMFRAIQTCLLARAVLENYE